MSLFNSRKKKLYRYFSQLDKIRFITEGKKNES